MDKQKVAIEHSQLGMSDAPPPSYEAATAEHRQSNGVISVRNLDDSAAQALASSTAPSSYSSDSHMLPCVIPRRSSTTNTLPYPRILLSTSNPFTRAYAPALEEHGLAKSDMVTFIDGLNEAFVANPVLQTTGIVGQVLTMFYGIQPVQWAGAGLQVASGLASFATSYGRTRAYVKAVNVDLFHPIGLHCGILSTKKMMQKIGIEGSKLQLPAAEPGSRIASLQNSSKRRDSSSSSSSDSSIDNNTAHAVVEEMHKRRIESLQGHVQPLSFDVPPAATPDNFLRRMGNAQAKRMQRKQEKKLAKRLRKSERASTMPEKKQRERDKKVAEIEKKMAEEHKKMEHDLGKKKALKDPEEAQKIKLDYEKEHSKLQRELDREHARFARKMDKHARKAEKRPGKYEKKAGKHDRKEEKMINKTRWIVIYQQDENPEEDDDDSSDVESEQNAPEGYGTDSK